MAGSRVWHLGESDSWETVAMRVLVVHNRYSARFPSGENVSVGDEIAWLRGAGVTVTTLEATNDDIYEGGVTQRAQIALSSAWSLPARRRMAAALDADPPDLVHVHNLFPLLSGSVVAEAVRRRLPVVWTVRNHRSLCVAGTHSRDGAPCHLCRPGWRVAGIRHRCYKGSLATSTLLTGATAAFRSMARRRVTAIAISDSLRRWLIDEAGFPPQQVELKYNGIAGPASGVAVPPAQRNRVILYAGYLAPYKGTPLLLEAWKNVTAPDLELHIVGDGPSSDDVQAVAANDPRVRFVGTVPRPEMAQHFAAARAIVVPSAWDEPFGRLAAEALSYGRPVITTGLGGLREVVDESTGWITGTDVAALTAAITEAAADEPLAPRAAAATERHARLFSPEATTARLLDIYRALGDRVPKDPG
jgi:glycosyltransferase involved in cell wall biosynthesis